MNFKIDQNYFYKLAEANYQKYISGTPFPYIVIDNVFPVEILDKILDEFPTVNEIDWIKFSNPNERKLASRDETNFGESTSQFIHVLNSKPFLVFLEKLTGIENLIPDPALEGGGLHQILPGGLLKIHADFNKHSKTNLDRRLNLLIYLNKDWEDQYGGHFELWNEEMTKSEVKILPIFNRVAIFSTTSKSYHGHPDPLTCPPDRSRKSIALYYYTNGRPDNEIIQGFERHSTIFKNRSDKDEVKTHVPALRFRDIIKKFIPPILIEIKNKFLS